MSWHCSRALVAEFSAANCSDGKPSALSSTTPTPEAYYWPDKTTEHSRLSRFGMTSELLTESLGGGHVDVVSGGFPCQDISAAGKGGGIDGERSGLWGEMARIVREVQPRFVFVENSPMLTSRGLGRVLGDLAEMGFDAEWGVVSAADTGAPHLRERIWILANAGSGRCGESEIRQMEQSRRAEVVGGGFGVADAVRDRSQGQREGREAARQIGLCGGARGDKEQRIPRWLSQWPIEPELGRVVNGLAHRVDRLKAIGNGQVSRVAATAWRILI